MLILLMSLAPAFAQDCENPEWIANEVEQYISNFLLDDAVSTLERAELAFGCAEPADPTVLARLFNAQGSVAFFNSDLTAASRAYAAANRVAPSVWNPTYGDDARATYDAAVAARSDQEGQIEFLPVPRGYALYLDGEPVELPVTAATGLHLVQIQVPDGAMAYATRVTLPAGASTTVTTGLPAGKPSRPEPLPVTTDTGATPAPLPDSGPAPLLLAGGGVAAAGALLGTATWAMTRGTNRVVSEEYESSMRTANLTGWGLAGVGIAVGVAGAVGGGK